MGYFKRKFHVEGDIAYQRLLVSENQSNYPFTWYQNVGNMFIRFVTNHACRRRTDRQTNGRQNYDPQYRASMAASRDKKWAVAKAWHYNYPSSVQLCYIKSFFLCSFTENKFNFRFGEVEDCDLYGVQLVLSTDRLIHKRSNFGICPMLIMHCH